MCKLLTPPDSLPRGLRMQCMATWIVWTADKDQSGIHFCAQVGRDDACVHAVLTQRRTGYHVSAVTVIQKIPSLVW